MAPLKSHLNKGNSYWKRPSRKLRLKSSSMVILLGFKNRAYKFSEKRACTINELSIRIDRGLETVSLFVIRECSFIVHVSYEQRSQAASPVRLAV